MTFNHTMQRYFKLFIIFIVAAAGFILPVLHSDCIAGQSYLSPNLVEWNGNLVADFGDNGLWYHDGTNWNWMTNDGHVGQMLPCDGKLVVDFGADTGIYNYDGAWHWMTNNHDPNMMISWNNGTTEKLVVDYGSGNRIYTYDGSWHWFSNKDGVADMTVWNNKLIVDFGSGRGVYNYDTSWHWMTNKDDVAMMLPWDNGTTEKLVVDFGGGRRMYTYDGAWSWFTNKDDVNDMAVWNNKLIVDFGSGRGVYNYDTSWHWMTNKDDVARMVAWNDGISDNLAVDFGNGRNMYNYDGAWSWIKNANDVPEMLAWNNRLVVDFGTGTGVNNFNGAWHKMKDWSTESTLTNSLGMTFNLIPSGTFTMGSPEGEPGRYSDETQHQVTLTQSYYMQTTEVTQGQWQTVMGSNPSFYSSCGSDCPVESVSWNDAQTFITALNALGEGTYRLPTEAEWEYAARAGSTTAFANGPITVMDCSYDANLNAMGWYCYNSGNTTHPVAEKQANAWGLYDMHGNVCDWCSDWYGSYPAGSVVDPTGPSTGTGRVLRGGGWSNNAQRCRSASRGDLGPSYWYANVGFRLVLLPGQ